MEHEGDGDTNCNRSPLYIHQKIDTGTGERGNKKTSGYHPINRIAEIGQNTERSPGYFRRLAVTLQWISIS